MAKKALTKSQFMAAIAEDVELPKKKVAEVFESMGGLIKKQLASAGVINLAGLMKVSVTRKPATQSRPGVNPFTGENIIIKAKPARNVVKVRPLKTLKDMV